MDLLAVEIPAVAPRGRFLGLLFGWYRGAWASLLVMVDW